MSTIGAEPAPVSGVAGASRERGRPARSGGVGGGEGPLWPACVGGAPGGRRPAAEPSAAGSPKPPGRGGREAVRGGATRGGAVGGVWRGRVQGGGGGGVSPCLWTAPPRGGGELPRKVGPGGGGGAKWVLTAPPREKAPPVTALFVNVQPEMVTSLVRL